MEIFAEYLAKIDNQEHQERMKKILTWVMKRFPNLMPKIAWNQPMFTDHGTFIIGFSISNKHIAIAPEILGLNNFEEEIADAGYEHTKELIQIPWDKEVDYTLLEKIIEFNIFDKSDCLTFWRKLD